jgi:anti-sigma regulatory factor (Ser/Thr protein kinase)
MGFTVETMEDWPADPSAPDAVSVGRVDACDLVVLLVARRRGHVPSGATLSITQQEYEQAKKLGIDRLVFLLDDHAPWHRHYDELDVDPGIRAWRRELENDHVAGYFGLEPESVEIEPALVRWLSRRGRLTSMRSAAAADELSQDGGLRSVGVAASDERALHALIGAFRHSSPATDFADRDFQALEIAALELFRNGERHVTTTPRTDLTVSLSVEHIEAFGSRGIVLEVSDEGPGFDFAATMERLEHELTDTGIEHGLLRAARKGTVVAQASWQPHTMGWMKLRSPAMPAPTFSEEIAVPLIYSWRDSAVRIWNDLYTLDELDAHLARCDAFVDLVFDPLVRADRPVVGIEVLGHHGTMPTDMDPVGALLTSLLRFQEREAFFTKSFAVFADTEPSDHRRLRTLCRAHGIPLFEDPRTAGRFKPDRGGRTHRRSQT